MRIAAVSAAQVRPLRSVVLRPGVPAEKLVYDGDETPDALHLAAIVGDRIVGIASLAREPAPGRAGADAWRLRGMATLPEVRGRGLGARLLRGCFDHVRRHGGGLLWCNARVVALGFYEKLGLRREGGEFDIPGIGPHYVMTCWLPRLRPIRPGEAAGLSALALRSKASWGYDAAFLERCEPVLRVRESPTLHHVVAEVGGRATGFHTIGQGANGEALLDALFIEPDWQGRGIGRQLFQDARELAARLGAVRLVTAADPNAAAFYARMGMRPAGHVPSDVAAGRLLPRFVLDLP